MSIIVYLLNIKLVLNDWKNFPGLIVVIIRNKHLVDCLLFVNATFYFKISNIFSTSEKFTTPMINIDIILAIQLAILEQTPIFYQLKS